VTVAANFGGCGTNLCHNNGQNGTPRTSSYTWGTAINGVNSCTECHNDTSATLTTQSHQAHLQTSTGGGQVCSDCHTAATLTTHNDGSVTFVPTLAYTGNVQVTVAANFGNCGTNLCHNNGQNGTPRTSSYTWGTAINGTNSCTECHNDTSATLTTQSHQAHLQTSTGGGQVCSDCHLSATLTTHNNGSVNFVPTLAYTGDVQVTVAANFGNCGTNLCHNNGQNGTPRTSSYTWGTAINGTNSCTECHNDTSATLTTQSHQAHLQTSTGGGQLCSDCHTAATLTTHNDGSVNFVPTLAYTGNTQVSVAANFGGCGTNLCHNNGQNGTPRTSSYTWGTAINGTNSCTECHGDTSSTLTTNAHNNHLSVAAGYVVCTDCHASQTLTTHNNGTVNLGGARGIVYSGNTVVTVAGSYGSCTTGSCHNAPGGTQINWDTTQVSCNQCHQSSGADTNNWNGQDKTATMISGGEYTNTTTGGHGGTLSGRAINLACTACHSTAQPHDFTTNLGGSNPFRLIAGFSCMSTTLSGTNCHLAGTTGPQTGVTLQSIRSHNASQLGLAGYTTKRTWTFAPDCINCHDPHGDGNLSMIGRATYDKSPFSLVAGPPPAFPTDHTSMLFTNNTVGIDLLGDSYANSASPYSNICQACHQDASMQSFRDNSSTLMATNHPTLTPPADCTGCHKHDSAFKPSGCTSCHGDGGSNNWPIGAAYPNTAGGHPLHVSAIMAAGAAATSNATCTFCHPGNPPNGHSTDTSTGANQAEVIRMDTNNDGTADKWLYSDSSTAVSGTLVYFKDLSSVNMTSAWYEVSDSSCKNIACHGGLGSIVWGSTGNACSACHGTFSSHTKIQVSDTSGQACTGCHPGGSKFPTKHNKNGSNYVILIPNNTKVGINYDGTHENGIHLGGDATSAWQMSTEAELCWRCHDYENDGILNGTNPSEWGTNNRYYAPTNNFNWGTLSNRNWTVASWTSARSEFAYKTGAIQSTHSANSAGAARGVDAVGNIRCSYCHNVHDYQKLSTFTSTGKPWLRESWLSNPYKQDGAPRSGMTFVSYNNWGAVPRASTQQTTIYGGYWIDANSGSPVSSYSGQQFGGLCGLCHNSNGGYSSAWANADYNYITYYDTSFTGWVSGKNGHGNAVKSGTWPAADSTARNIFNARGGSSSGATSYAGLQHYQGSTTNNLSGRGFRNSQGLSFQPTNTTCAQRQNTDEWGVDEYGTATQTNYHNFSCSKCHNPHASRLPALMITNCLDTKHNNWDNSYAIMSVSGGSGVNYNRSLSQWSNAQNCHRLVGNDGYGTPGASGGGWNKVTPW
jgi:nitrate/TMAO reductase-like tetraheme cytochrome c subunit